MRRIISVLLENESGALSRLVGLFSQRGYNIDTLTVAPTDDESLSRLTLTTTGDARMAEQVVKQLHKLIDTLKVNDLTQGPFVERELMLVKIAAPDDGSRAEIMRCVEIFRGNIVDVTAVTYTVQLLGDSDKLDAFLEAIKHIGSIEVVRSGVVGVARGDKFLRQ
ncbi:MAG: acetolactate synthase small subunit [Cellvibrionales bacterium TMED49]|nr:acetolactate synthase small subunit [Porticoccaceae bacterium]OUU39582.1 MAG: acetolactate synthase small subunit [Cellvibrionales bacterium TMED49]